MQAAFESASARKCDAELRGFAAQIKGRSKAVVARPLATIHDLLREDGNSYVSFQKQVASGVRTPKNNEFDKVRKQYEEALFPYFSEEIVFGSLSLSDTGMSAYGAFTIVLNDRFIGHRASVFEENPHTFVERHRLMMNQQIPPGYRADWEHREELAVAKLHSRIEPGMRKEQYGGVLERDAGGSGNGDWIEVHVYGSININAVESIVGHTPKTKADRVLWRSMKARLKSRGVKVVDK